MTLKRPIFCTEIKYLFLRIAELFDGLNIQEQRAAYKEGLRDGSFFDYLKEHLGWKYFPLFTEVYFTEDYYKFLDMLSHPINGRAYRLEARRLLRNKCEEINPFGKPRAY